MTRSFFTSAVLFTAFTFTCSAGGRIETVTMRTNTLKGVSTRDFSILLPESYSSEPGKTYPVLYLLHGGGGHHTDWPTQGNLLSTYDTLVKEGKTDEMIIVCPEGGENLMIWFNLGEWRYSDYFFGELIPYIEKNYRTKAEKRYRGVAGLSMGGGGSVVHGVEHPELFNMVFDMSGYLRAQDLPFLPDDEDSRIRQACVEEHNPIKAIQNATPEKIRSLRTVRWFIDCGDQDFTLEANMDLVKVMREKDIPYEMRVRSGSHDWNYWKESLKMALEYFSSSMYKSKVIDGGGSGDYPSVALTERSLPDFVVYRPQDIAYASATEGPLPVLIFANGGCNNTSITHEKVLGEIASHGYIAIALGDMQNRLDDRDIVKAPDQMMTQALDWIIKQNRDEGSPYFGKIDEKNIAFGGQSCGGAQVINMADDPRVRTYLMFNSGIGDMEMDGCTKEKLSLFHGPVLYIIGDDEDVAYPNALKDFARISGTPVAFANLKDGGHMGTFGERFGGSFARIALDWLDWQLKGRVSRSVVFLNGKTDTYPGWTIENKGFLGPVFTLTEYTIENLNCKSAGKKIWGQVYKPKGIKGKIPFVVIGHGYNSSYREAVPYAEALASHGIGAVVFDFCGGSMTSKSEGSTLEMSVFTESSDMKAVVSKVKSFGWVDKDKVTIMGCSQGGLVASITAASVPEEVSSLILIYPALTIAEAAVTSHPKEAIHSEKFNLMGLDISHVFYDNLIGYDVFQDVKKFHKPTVAIYGDRDPIAAGNSIGRAKDSFSSFEAKPIAKGTHGFPAKDRLDKAVGYVLDFMGKLSYQ
ncbi:MAG: alpha/beta hydrolase [Bacteroidales bacterium]|nr:alpha/beta hydrolase [Bacteroidales bacterium]